MKIAIPSTSPDLNGSVEHKLGNAAYLLVIETEDMTCEVLDGPDSTSGPGAGIQAISLVLGMGAQALLVGYLAPHIIEVLKSENIDVQTGVTGTIFNAVTHYLHKRAEHPETVHDTSISEEPDHQTTWPQALSMGIRQFTAILPMLVGVIFLLGLFQEFVSQEMLMTLFSGSTVKDSFLGAALGSVMAGNPVNSYVIGKSLLQAGVGLAGISALMLAWVSVGLIQLPAEAASLGWRFALVRNIAGFCVAALMALGLSLLAGALT